MLDKEKAKKIKNYLSNFELYKSFHEVYMGIVILLILLSFSWIFVTASPNDRSIPFSIVIEKGSTLKEISQQLKDTKLIRSVTIFNSLVIIKAGESRVVSGEYLFHFNPSVFDIVKRLTTGDYGIDAKTIRIPEGITNIQTSELFAQEFIRFDAEAFLELANGKEGRLFPDTYVFLENIKAHQVLETLEENFNKKLESIRGDLIASGRTDEEIIIMASIIEEEATKEARQEVSNILWSRIEIDMALQVDATFVYERGKGTFDLTQKDLVTDSPYNTYTNKGLPPTAISNPGLESLKAAATPTTTPYLYFLTGHDGEMYYAESFEGHKRNKARYLY